MADPISIVTYLAGLVGVVAAVLFVYVYRTATELEVAFAKMRQRSELLVHDLDSLHSNLTELREKSKAKASYQEAEQLLAAATGKLMLKDKQVALEPLNSNIRVEVK
ncbi:hypothetical protein HY994_05675 [Candidatus Micrarchaeota archaeon]|nr:hypothetical protein [Candidatus Micrarchaeota archaeon]